MTAPPRPTRAPIWSINKSSVARRKVFAAGGFAVYGKLCSLFQKFRDFPADGTLRAIGAVSVIIAIRFPRAVIVLLQKNEPRPI